MSSKQYDGKVIIITGGASDIGQAIMVELLEFKCKVILLDINKEGLDKIARTNDKLGDSLETEVIDMTNPEFVKSSFERILSKYGKIDYVFNIVGFAMVGEVKDMKLQDWQSIVNANLNGVLYPTINAYEIMTNQGFGHIVNMSSLAGITPSPFNTAYSTTKHGLVGLSISLREEAKAYGVNVTVVCAGGLRTKLWDSVRLINIQREKFNSLVPPKTLMIPSKAARVILKQVKKNKAIIVFPLFANVSNFLYKYFPNLYSVGMKVVIKSLNSAKEVNYEKCKTQG